ncbi:hypothetical protein MRX96_015140 [Rhipicephalus microplus]
MCRSANASSGGADSLLYRRWGLAYCFEARSGRHRSARVIIDSRNKYGAHGPRPKHVAEHRRNVRTLSTPNSLLIDDSTTHVTHSDVTVRRAIP